MEISTGERQIGGRRRKKFLLPVVAVMAIFLLLGVGIFGILREAPSLGARGFLAEAGGPFGSTFVGQIGSVGELLAAETELVLFGFTGVKANTPPGSASPQVLGAIVGGTGEGVNNGGETEISLYIVEDGDTVSSVAEKFWSFS